MEVRQQHCPWPLTRILGTLTPQEQQGAPILQRNPSATPRMQGMVGVAALRQNSSLMQRHSTEPAQPINLAKSVDRRVLQQQQPLNTCKSLVSTSAMFSLTKKLSENCSSLLNKRAAKSFTHCRKIRKEKETVVVEFCPHILCVRTHGVAMQSTGVGSLGQS